MAAPNSTLPPTKPDDQDKSFNPAELRAQEMFDGYTSSGIDQLESYANDDANHSKNIDSREKDASSHIGGLYTPSVGGTKKKFDAKKFALSLIKKRSPLTIFVVMLLGGGGFALFLTPGLGLMQLKETLMGDLNDQLAAVDIRSSALWRSRLNSLQTGTSVCTSTVQIKCKFSTMSTKQVQRFKDAGFKIETSDSAFGRKTVTSLIAPNDVEIDNPQKLRELIQTDPATRSALTKVFNPLYASLSDKTFAQTLQKLKTSKRSVLTGNTKEELDTSVRENTSGDPDSGSNGEPMKERDGRKYFLDGDEKVYEGDERYTQLEETAKEKVQGLKTAEVSGKAVNNVLTGAVKGVGVLGAADASCTIYNLGRAVSAASKVARSEQLAQFAMIYLNGADKIIEGDGVPEETNYLNNNLTATDNRKKVVDELATVNGSYNADELREYVRNNPDAVMKDNPNFGKNAFDSDAYSVIAHNATPTLSAEDQQYLVGGGMSGSLSGTMDRVKEMIGGNPAEVCGVIQSWWVRGAGLAVGVVAGIGSFGVLTALSVGGSVAISLAAPLLEAMLVDIVQGNVTAGLEGPQSMTAITAGSATIFGSAAQARGMKPQTASDLETYLATTENVKNEYIAMERYEAASTPFDIKNQYSFLGSLARTAYIPVTKAGSSVGGALSAVPALLSASVATIIPTASAASEYNPHRFNKCADEGYAELNIAADVFCNVRFGMSPEELRMAPEVAVDYLLNTNQITEDGSPIPDSNYDLFTRYCSGGRAEGWGETGEETGDPARAKWASGAQCMEESDEMSYFRVYTMDNSLLDAMDEIDVEQAAAEGSGTPTDGLVSPVSGDGFRYSDGFGPRSCSGCSPWHQGVDYLNNTNPGVYAVMAGTVKSANKSGGNNVVEIQHSDGLVSSYWHMFASDILVSTGDTVTAGQKIGTIGNSGQSYGAHLHFEFDISGVQDRASYESKYIVNTGGGYNPGQRIDATDYFKKNGVVEFQ